MKKRLSDLAYKINNSQWYDFVGVGIIIFASISLGFMFTMLSDLPIAKGISWAKYVPFGLISTVSAVASVYSTRLVSKVKIAGVILGTVQVVLACAIDYALGNKAAIITYPVTFVINAVAIYAWKKFGDKVNTVGLGAIVISTVISFTFSAIVNFSAFGWKWSWLCFLTTIVFGLATVANILNAMKVNQQWHFWFFYNVIQLIKSLTQFNFANVAKYVYYIFDSVIANVAWLRHKKVGDPNGR